MERRDEQVEFAERATLAERKRVERKDGPAARGAKKSLALRERRRIPADEHRGESRRRPRGKLADEQEPGRRDRGGKHSYELQIWESLDGGAVPQEDESLDAPVKSGRRAREIRSRDETVRIV